MAKKPTSKIPTKLGLLSDADKAALRAEAKKSILSEMEQDARDAYFASELAKLRRAEIPAEQIVHVSLDLAPFLPNVMIDGTQFFHGYSYDVPRSQALVLYEQMQRSWAHQDEIEGRNRFSAYRRPQNVQLGPRHIGQATVGPNGVVSLPADTEI